MPFARFVSIVEITINLIDKKIINREKKTEYFSNQRYILMISMEARNHENEKFSFSTTNFFTKDAVKDVL